MIIRVLFILVVVGFFSGTSLPAFSTNHLIETRYCMPVVRDANGVIVRSTAVTREFKKAHPCPATGLTYGACVGWQINHVIPLACGGCDAVSNAQWIPVEIKACSQWYCIDRFERRIYGKYPDTNCTAPPLK